jgi:hypothetical protein
MTVAFNLGGSPDKDIHGYCYASQTVLRSDSALDGLLLAISDDDQQI